MNSTGPKGYFGRAMHSNGGKVSTGMRASCKDSTMWPLYNELVFAVFAETDKPFR